MCRSATVRRTQPVTAACLVCCMPDLEAYRQAAAATGPTHYLHLDVCCLLVMDSICVRPAEVVLQDVRRRSKEQSNVGLVPGPAAGSRSRFIAVIAAVRCRRASTSPASTATMDDTCFVKLDQAGGAAALAAFTAKCMCPRRQTQKTRTLTERSHRR